MNLGFVILLPLSRLKNNTALMLDIGGKRIPRIFRDSKGLSNVVVVMLSLVIVVIIVVNVVLWSYQMNQFDLERMHEDVKIADVERVNSSSPWFSTQNEFVVDAGSRLSGTYADTQSIDGSYETFAGNNACSGNLQFHGTFAADISAYPLSHVQTVEILLTYRPSDTTEKWYMEAYNWTSSAFSDSGFNSTVGQSPTTGWNNYAVNLTDQWNSYIYNNGTISLKIHDEGADANQTTIDVDFIGIRLPVDAVSFTFTNEGSYTAQVVALWIDNSTIHQRFDASVYVNAGDTATYSRADVDLPEKPYTIKIITERGNAATYSPK
jgi:hypothetical protein